MLVPLVQQFVSYDGPSVNDTAFRLIAIQSFPNNYSGKLDLKVPVQWDNDKVERPICHELRAEVSF